MKYIHILSTILRNKLASNRSFATLRTICSINFLTSPVITKPSFVNHVSRKFVHNGNGYEDAYEDFSFAEDEIEHTESAKNILFNNYEDDIITKLNSCPSIEEVLNVVLKHKNIYEDKHIVQTVLILSDLQKMYYKYSGFDDTASSRFFADISQNEGFDILLECIKDKLDHFNPEYLSYVLLYLTKLGIPIENPLMQTMSLKVRDNLLNNFCLAQCSRFLKAIFYENSVRPYYLSLKIIPLVTNHIEKCNSVEDLCNLTICLNKLRNVVTSELLGKYKENVTEFLRSKKLKGSDYPTLLKIILFLNYPEWRDKSVLLISDCILLLKSEINLLNIENLTILYEIFFKNQEPGAILNSIQRCSAKFLHQLDETEATSEVLSLKLFSSLIFFSSPTHRIRFQKDIPKYLKNCTNYKALVELRKIFAYVKVSDRKLCEEYWNLCTKLLHENVTTSLVLKLCQDYIHFNINVNNYRHHSFEKKILDYLKRSVTVDLFLTPAKISGYLNFVLLFGKNDNFFELLLQKFENSLSRVRPLDCLKLSHSLLHLNNRNVCVTPKQVQKIKTLLNKATSELLRIEENSSETHFSQNSILVKASILRNEFDNNDIEHLLFKYKELDYMSSKILESVSYIFLASGSLIPEVINKCTEYVIKYENNIVGFNAEKLLFLCFFLAYHPINGDKFFQVITNIIIRDQERLSGLAFLQSALALCFFNKLPGSFIRQIFNVEFLEKLDVELENCYAKDKYPQRVRKVLMMLNRAVCLEYPEYNVPWFHKKYIEDTQKKSEDMDSKFHQRVREYLMRVLRTKNHFIQNVFTPYGYHIDFVINFNKNAEVVPPDSPDINRRVALLLLRQKAFTRFYKHLKGKYQLKVRHLEMFGYEVAIINFNEWINLLYGEEYVEYLSKIIWPTGKDSEFGIAKR